MHSACALVWSAGLISFWIRTKGAGHECRNDAAGIRPAGACAATERNGDGQCGRRCLVVCVDRAAQAEAEVERSEGESEAQGRPVVVHVDGRSRAGLLGLAVVGWGAERVRNKP